MLQLHRLQTHSEKHNLNITIYDIAICVSLLSEACGESFDLVNSISFSRPRTEPLPPLLRRQPKDDPKVLKEDVPAKLKDGVMSDFEDRRKPRFTNANPDALSVCYVSGNRSLQALSSSGGTSLSVTTVFFSSGGVFCHLICYMMVQEC